MRSTLTINPPNLWAVRLWLPSLLAVIVFATFIAHLHFTFGWKWALLGAVGAAIGAVFLWSGFGFSYTWRAFARNGNGSGLRAQFLWIGLAAAPCAVLMGVGDWVASPAAANVRPLSAGVLAGGFIFGIGMQLGGACTSGAMMALGEGRLLSLWSLLLFVGGALLAASQMSFWSELPAVAPFSFYREWGLAGVMLTSLLALLLALATLAFPQRQNDKKAAKRLYWGAAALAVLSVLALYLGRQPWGIVNGITILGGKALLSVGVEDVEFWDYWVTMPRGEELLAGAIFDGAQGVTNVGFLLGVAVTAMVAKRFKFSWRIHSLSRLLWVMTGGFLMGYGAQISFGCNIGSYISGIISGSMHGWLWLVFAFIGSVLGAKLRVIAGLEGKTLARTQPFLNNK